jgi:hypothetical protein
VTRESATADRGAAAAALTPFTHRIYRARSRPAGDRTPCFLPTRLLKSPPTSPPSNSTRTPPRSTFDVGAQPGQDLRPALMRDLARKPIRGGRCEIRYSDAAWRGLLLVSRTRPNARNAEESMPCALSTKIEPDSRGSSPAMTAAHHRVTCADTASHFPFCFAQQSV